MFIPSLICGVLILIFNEGTWMAFRTGDEILGEVGFFLENFAAERETLFMSVADVKYKFMIISIEFMFYGIFR